MNDTERYLAELERDPEYLAARVRKLRREYGRVFAGPRDGRQRKLNELTDEMARHERALTGLGTVCLECFGQATTRVSGRPACAAHLRNGTNA